MHKTEFIEKLNKKIVEKDIINLTVELCKLDTTNPPGNEYLCTPILEKFFQEIGIKTIDRYEREKGRTNLVARIKGNNSGPTIAIVGHTDVVPVEGQVWETNPFDPKVNEGTITARGATDNKGPFAATLHALKAFIEIVGNNFSGEIMIISSADEELGSTNGIKYLFDEVGLKCDYALIPDGANFSEILYGEMGILSMEFKSTGRASHGSQPEDGYNAIAPLANLLELLLEYDWGRHRGHKDFDGTILNVGLISGGTAMNIVPDNAKMNAMWRYPVGIEIDEIEEVVDSLIQKVKNKYPESSISYENKYSSSPFIGNSDNELVSAMFQSCNDLGLPQQRVQTMRAETVAKYIAQLCGAEVLVNGVYDGQGKQMHMPNESIEIRSLINFAKYYALILFNLLKK